MASTKILGNSSTAESKRKLYNLSSLPIFQVTHIISQAQALKNIAAILKEAGTDFSKIMKLNVYLKSYADFAPMNEVYITHFGAVKPVSVFRLCGVCLLVNMLQARICVAVLDLPLDAIVEMECIALCPA